MPVSPCCTRRSAELSLRAQPRLAARVAARSHARAGVAQSATRWIYRAEGDGARRTRIRPSYSDHSVVKLDTERTARGVEHWPRSRRALASNPAATGRREIVHRNRCSRQCTTPHDAGTEALARPQSHRAVGRTGACAAPPSLFPSVPKADSADGLATARRGRCATREPRAARAARRNRRDGRLCARAGALGGCELLVTRGKLGDHALMRSKSGITGNS